MLLAAAKGRHQAQAKLKMTGKLRRYALTKGNQERKKRESERERKERETSQELGNCPMGQREALLKERLY